MALVTMHAFREQITQFILDTLQKEEILLQPKSTFFISMFLFHLIKN